MLKRQTVITAIILTTLATVALAHAQPSEPHAANSIWIEPSTLDISSHPLGYTFNVTLYCNVTHTTGTHGIGAWQFEIDYNSTYLNVTRVWYKSGKTPGQSQFFENITVKTVTPTLKSGSVLFGESWAGDPSTGPFAMPPLMGGLAIVEFNLTGLAPSASSQTTILDIATNAAENTLIADYDDYTNVIDNLHNSTVTIPIVPEFVTMAFLMALIAVSALALLARKSLKKPQ
jgi:hypothetical protein